MLFFFSGKLKPASAFMSGKLKLQGDMAKAMKLDKLMSQMHGRGFHTTTNNNYLHGTGKRRTSKL